MLNTNKETIII